MVAQHLIIIILFFEYIMIDGRPQNGYNNCCCTGYRYPCCQPTYSCTPSNTPSNDGYGSPPKPEPAPKPVPIPEVIAEPKKKHHKHQEDWISTNLFARLMALPGAVMDTIREGEIYFFTGDKKTK